MFQSLVPPLATLGYGFFGSEHLEPLKMAVGGKASQTSILTNGAPSWQWLYWDSTGLCMESFANTVLLNDPYGTIFQ